MKIIAVTDIHGCFHTFMDLLGKTNPDIVICTGDLTDRGRYPMEVIQWFIDNQDKSYCTLGNHDLGFLALEKGFRGFSDAYDFSANGGLPTELAYKEHPETLKLHADWIRERPDHLFQEDIPELKDNPHNFVFSHACYSMYERYGVKSDLIWSRSNTVSPSGRCCIFGHTPQKEIIPLNGNVCIDTGCVFEQHGYGKLSALDLDTLEVIDVPFNDKDQFKYPGE